MSEEIIPIQQIAQSIDLIRGQRVMRNQNLAILYGVAVKVLNQAVKRNAVRFPADFVFQHKAEELANLKSRFVTSSWGGSRRGRPYAATEQGVAMLSCGDTAFCPASAVHAYLLESRKEVSGLLLQSVAILVSRPIQSGDVVIAK